MNATEPILVLDGVFAGYGKMTILNGTTARMRRGAITTVIGPNGAGKSTLFKTIFGLLPVRSGTITFDGRDTTNFSPREILDAGVAYVPQGRNIFPELSVRHNLELGGVALVRPGRACRAASTRSCSGFRCCKEKANAQASTLSGGQQKMLEVARGLLLDPKLFLIDEPSIGLSPLMVQEVFAILERPARQGRHHPADRAERQAGAADIRLRIWCWSRGRPASKIPRRIFLPIRASRNCSSAAAWRRRRKRGMSKRRCSCRPDRRQHHEVAVAGDARGCFRRGRASTATTI